MNAARKTLVPLGTILILIIGSACSDGGDSPRAPTSAAPLVDAPAAREDEPSAPVHLQAGGIDTMYTAHYKDQRLRRITERRAGRGTIVEEGEYEFRGARLLRYRGAALDGAGSLVLELDLQGAVLTARNDGRPATDVEINAIRNRASLLVSHALAQQARSTHLMH